MKTGKKCTHFSSHAKWAKEPYFMGQQMLQFLVAEFIPNHKKCLKGKKDNFWLINGWFVQYLAGFWVVLLLCEWFGWFVSDLDSLWVVLSFKANV